MKALLLFISVSLLACSADKRDRFTRYLGITYSRSLDYSVEKLDNLILSYSTEENLNEAYSKFLADFYRGKDSLKEYLKNHY